MAARAFGKAVVLGSGMAGLVAARVLADHFEQVTVVERDAEPDAGFRPGLPQGRHFHALLPGGLRIISELFPGVTTELEAGGSLLPRPSQFYFYRPEGKSFALAFHMPEPPPDTGQRLVYVQTRGLLEHCVRVRVSALENVEVRYGTRVEGVLAADGRVRGVTLDDGAQTLEADLVVDALGRGSKTPQWLETLGYARPAEEIVECDFAYSSMLVEPHDPELFQDVGFFVFPNPSSAHPRRGGALVRMEGGRWLVSLGGRYGDYPPKELAEWMAWAKTLAEPRFYELVQKAKPVTEVAHYRFQRGVRRRYEKLDAFPAGLLPIGDAVCHYNPLYGQGMSAACRQGMALHRVLGQAAQERDGLATLWRAFLPEAYQETRGPWLFAAAADFADPACKGDFPSDEGETLQRLLVLRSKVLAGDREAFAALFAINGLIARLDLLDQSPWRERLAPAAVGGNA